MWNYCLKVLHLDSYINKSMVLYGMVSTLNLYLSAVR